MKKVNELNRFPLAGTKEGEIRVAKIVEPYGEDSKPVVSVAVSLSGNDERNDWKVHIPYENLSEVIEALKEAKERG
jgi:hypothetical protein